MRILAFESSAKAASCAVLEDGVLVGEYYQNHGQTHSRTLTKMAENLLQNCDLSPEEIDVAAVAAGPGSFTGVRIGVAAAKGFAWARSIPCCGISTLEAMAELFRTFAPVIVPVMDARRSEVYCAVYTPEENNLRAILPDSAIALSHLKEILCGVSGKKLLIGDGAVLCYNALSDSVKDLTLLPEHLRLQRASGVALVAARRLAAGETFDAETMVPNYLRLSQAERERNEKLAAEMAENK